MYSFCFIRENHCKHSVFQKSRTAGILFFFNGNGSNGEENSETNFKLADILALKIVCFVEIFENTFFLINTVVVNITNYF